MPSQMLAATVRPEEKRAFEEIARARGVSTMSHLRRLIRDEIARNAVPTPAATDDEQTPLFVQP